MEGSLAHVCLPPCCLMMMVSLFVAFDFCRLYILEALKPCTVLVVAHSFLLGMENRLESRHRCFLAFLPPWNDEVFRLGLLCPSLKELSSCTGLTISLLDGK